MEQSWISLQRVAVERHLTLAQAAELAEREHWPKVFRLHETLVLVPAARG